MQAANQGVDANDFAVDIHQRTAAVSGVDVRVGLNKILVHCQSLEALDHFRASLGAHMAEGHAVIEAERSSDGDGEFANARFAGVRQHCHREAFCLDFNHCHIGLRIDAPDLRFETPSILKPDGDAFRILHHMAVGENIAVVADDDAGAFAFNGLLVELLLAAGMTPALGKLARQGVSGTFPILFEERCRHFLHDCDDDHRRRNLFG